MSYIRTKIISGKPYLYEQSSHRNGKTIDTKHERYIGGNSKLAYPTIKQLSPNAREKIEIITKAKRIVFSDQETRYAIRAAERLYRRGFETKNIYFNKELGQYNDKRKIEHEKILSKLLDKPESTSPADQKPHIILLGGPAGSGKSSAILDKLDKSKYVVLDSDYIKSRLPEYRGYNAQLLHEESSDIYDEARDRAIMERKNLILDATLKSYDKAVKSIELFRKLGYYVELSATNISKEGNIPRVAQRATRKADGTFGRYVPIEFVHANTDKINESVQKLTTHVDKFTIYNTDVPKGHTPKIITQGVNIPR
jgi:predicted ABC-type ATPase